MRQIITIGLYVLCSVSGVVCIKLGSSEAMAVEITQKIFFVKISWLTIFGLGLYVVSFLIYIGLISKNTLSYLTPITVGAVYLLTLLSSVVIFKEKLQLIQILGSAFILVGVILMNIKAK